ncbi:MAG: UDP-N-acetylmuramate dehydrogenase [Saprospiraceae bacterium]
MSINLPPNFQIKKNQALKKYNTFGLNVKAKAFLPIYSTIQLQKLLNAYTGPLFILGGGSNMLLTKDIEALVLHNQIMGQEISRSFKHSVYVRAGGGENWHEFVLWTISQGLGGIENLSLIPGTVGASPIQNIGAYGVELKDVFHQLKAVDLKTGELKTFRHKDCNFGYRDSIFKRKLKGKYFITEVIFKLSLKPKVNISYGAIQQVLKDEKIKNPTIADVSKAVIQIRSSKLPDPKKIGNSGSFFKNPEVSNKVFTKIQKQYPKMPFYDLPNGKVKIPAGWLIEKCGWKGKRVGETGCHKNQALVLVNYGKAKGKDIWAHAERVMADVEKQFGIRLEAEVNVIS